MLVWCITKVFYCSYVFSCLGKQNHPRVQKLITLFCHKIINDTQEKVNLGGGGFLLL